MRQSLCLCLYFRKPSSCIWTNQQKNNICSWANNLNLVSFLRTRHGSGQVLGVGWCWSVNFFLALNSGYSKSRVCKPQSYGQIQSSTCFCKYGFMALGHTHAFTYVCSCFPAIAEVANGSESLEYLLSNLLHNLLIPVYEIGGNWIIYVWEWVRMFHLSLEECRNE